MAALTNLNLTEGAPGDTGTIKTLDGVFATVGGKVDGADATIGSKADAKNSATDTTAVSAMSVWKQISSSIQAVAAALVGTAILGKVGIDQTTPGTTDSVTVSTGQGAGAAIGAVSGAAVVTDANGTIQQYLRGLVKLCAQFFTQFNTCYYVTVAASQTNQVIQSSAGAAGDYLDRVLVIPATTAPGVVTISDNAGAVVSYPGGGTTALLTLTPFTIPIGAVSRSGAWKITTGANVSCVAVGKFS